MTSDATQKSVFVDLSLLLDIKKYVNKNTHFKNKKQSVHGVGSLKSPFKTKGLDFQEVRHYQPGDDIRQIDWRVTAKYNKPFTKLYTDEKQEQIIILCDMRTRMKFASTGTFKSVALAKMTAFLTFLSQGRDNGLDFVALLPDKVKTSAKLSASDKGMHLLQLLAHESNPNNMPVDTTNLTQGLKQLLQINKKGSAIFILSDFSDLTDADALMIKQLSHHSTCNLIHIYDELEKKLPAGYFRMTNGVENKTIDTTSTAFQKKYQHQFDETVIQLHNLQKSMHINGMSVKTSDAIIPAITQFCQGHIK